MGKQIYIAWIGYQRRPELMSGFFDFAVYYMESRYRAKRYKLFGYLSQAWRTIAVLRKTKPDVDANRRPPSWSTSPSFIAPSPRDGCALSRICTMPPCAGPGRSSR